MAQNHYSTKRNRRPKNKRRKDYTAETMRKLREHTAMQRPMTVADLREICDILRKQPLPAWVRPA
jgi:hypothetical protein